jgi:branched-chain amino acid transport system permease protein
MTAVHNDLTPIEAAPDSPAPRARWSIADLRTAVATGRGKLYLPRHITLLVFAAVVLIVGMVSGSDTRYSLILATVYAVAILGNNAVHATLGELNLSAGAFIALGAYITANGLSHGWPVLLTFAVAVVGSFVVGAIFALPTMRLRGISTALLTFALAYSIPDLSTYLNAFTGGDAGIYVPSDITFGGLTFSGSSTGMLILCVVVMVLAGVAHLALLHARAGRLAIAVGESEAAAAVFAIRVRALKLGVWAWAAALGGASGFLYALATGFVTSSQWQVNLSIFILAGGLIGGSRSASGAWLGGMLVGGLPLWLQDAVPIAANYIAYGAILLVALLAGGKGLAEFVERGYVWVLAKLKVVR